MTSLNERISQVLKDSNKIINRNLKKYEIKLDFVNIFCQSSQEYDFLASEVIKIGNILKETTTGIYVDITTDLNIEGWTVPVIKIRKPDTSRKQNGASNFTSPEYQQIREDNLISDENFKLNVNTLNTEELNIIEEDINSYVAIVSVPVLQSLNVGNGNKESELGTLISQLEEEKQRRLQVISDFQNYQKRVENEKAMFGAVANMGLIQEMLEIFDDINLALNDENIDIEHAKTSMKSAQDKLLAATQMAGVERIDVSIGDDFDKEKMEAISMVPVQDENQKGKVIAVISSAYKYKDRDGILKAAKVVVGK